LIQKIGAADLVGVPPSEIKTSAVARNLTALASIASVTAESDDLLSIGLDGQDNSSEERDSETHCRGSV
jgi:hypothetical protein